MGSQKNNLKRQQKRHPQPSARQNSASSLSVEQHQIEAFSGPLPHPEHLKQYDLIVPGAADRILKQAEQQTTHRIKTESRAVSAEIAQNMLAQVFAFILALTGIGGGILLTLNDHGGAGGTLMTVTIGTLCVAYLKSRK